MAARLLSCPSAISSPTLGPGGPASRLPGSSKARSLPWSLPSSGLSLLPLVQLTSLLPSSGLTSPSCAASPTPLWEHRRASCTLPQNSLLRFTCAARSVSEVGEESGSSGSQLGSARNPDQFPALSLGQLCPDTTAIKRGISPKFALKISPGPSSRPLRLVKVAHNSVISSHGLCC